MFRRHYYPILPSLSVILLIIAGLAYLFREQIPWDLFVPKDYQNQFITATNGVSRSVQEVIPNDTSDQITTLTSRAQGVTGHVQQVLGENVQVNEDQKPLHEKVYEYTQYQYCLQVIQEYEKQEK